MKVEILQKENPAFIKLIGRIDSITAGNFEDEVKDYIKAPTSDIIFDISELEYISSAGLRVFLLLLSAMSGKNLKMVLISPQQMIKEVFDISGISHIVRWADTFDEAISKLN